MRKVRTALDTAIRTKDVRSFSGRSGWSGRSGRGHPGRSATGFSGAGTGRRRNASAIAYRKEAIGKLSSSQRRAFEKLPVQTQEELLVRAENRIDRRISAGRYRDYGTTAAVAARSAGRGEGSIRPEDPHVSTFTERMDSFGIRKFQNDPAGVIDIRRQAMSQTKNNGQQEQKNEDNSFTGDEPSLRRYGTGPDLSYPASAWGADPFSRSYRRRARQNAEKARERRIRIWRRVAGGSRTGNPFLELKDKPNGGGNTEESSRSGENSGNSGRDQKNRSTGDKAGKKISHDYAKTLGRLVESQVRFTKQLENSRANAQRQKTIQELKEKEAGRAYRVVSFSLSKAKAAAGDLVKAVKALASKGKGYLILLLVPVMLLVMMVPLLLSSVSMTDEEATASITATELVEYALSWVGVTQYIYGDGRAYETDWQDFADCSSYVHGVFSHFGYEIGYDTVSMEGSGTLVEENSTDKALPGDIVLFFSGGISPGASTHVGIYIGNGQMVHCSGGRMNKTPETAGPGVMVAMVSGDGRPWQVRRIIQEGAYGGIGTGGHRVDPTNYSASDLQLIWAIVAQEDNGSYEGALAVISSAMNRTESPVWGYLGNTAMQQLCAPGQYCYSNDHYWEARLGGNVPEYVKQAVNDCLKKGIRNHAFTCFRSTKGSQTGPDAVQIGGNWFFGN